jgi:hypothetical protein
MEVGKSEFQIASWAELNAPKKRWYLKNGVFIDEDINKMTELLPKRVQFLLNVGFIHPAFVNWQQTHSCIDPLSHFLGAMLYLPLTSLSYCKNNPIALHLQAIQITSLTLTTSQGSESCLRCASGIRLTPTRQRSGKSSPSRVRTCGLVGNFFFTNIDFITTFLDFTYTFTSILCTISLIKLYHPFYLHSTVWYSRRHHSPPSFSFLVAPPPVEQTLNCSNPAI